MKLSKRIRDLVRAGLASPRRLSTLGKAGSPRQMEAQLEQIRKSLTGAAGREKRLGDELALAEREGRERDAIRLRRELAELRRSTDELRAALDRIEARIEMTRQPEATTGDVSPAVAELDSSQIPLDEPADDAGLAARKTRLSAPKAGRRG